MSEGTAGSGLYRDARERYEAGDFENARDLALAELRERPEDAELLRFAGKSSLELGLDDAVAHLERLTALQPDDPDAWRDLGDALVVEGRPAEAADAFRRAVELRPEDAAALIDLAHSAYAAGDAAAAIDSLERAVEQEPAGTSVLRSLSVMYRRAGRLEDALAAAGEITERQPDDVRAALDIAEVNLELGRLDDAAAAFARLRGIDDDAGHEVFAFHGMIEAEIRREAWRRALDLAVDATRVDRHGRTTDVLAFAVAQVFGETDRPTPTRAEIEAALEASRAEHRRLHDEAVAL
jgi:tetratricopeptide (TPR) repeat protein